MEEGTSPALSSRRRDFPPQRFFADRCPGRAVARRRSEIEAAFGDLVRENPARVPIIESDDGAAGFGFHRKRIFVDAHARVRAVDEIQTRGKAAVEVGLERLSGRVAQFVAQAAWRGDDRRFPIEGALAGNTRLRALQSRKP